MLREKEGERGRQTDRQGPREPCGVAHGEKFPGKESMSAGVQGGGGGEMWEHGEQETRLPEAVGEAMGGRWGRGRRLAAHAGLCPQPTRRR